MKRALTLLQTDFKLSIILVFYILFHSQRGQKHSLLSGTSPYSTMKVNLHILGGITCTCTCVECSFILFLFI